MTLCNIIQRKDTKNPAPFGAGFFMEIYLFAFLAAQYTGRPSRVMPMEATDMMVAFRPDRASWLTITYRPLAMARTGMTG